MSRPFADSSAWKLIDWLGDLLVIPEKYSVHLLAIQWGYGTRAAPDLRNLRLWREDPPSLFMNGVVFAMLRIAGIGAMLRFSRERFIQCYFGFKGNGRWAMGFWWVLLLPPALYFQGGWSWWFMPMFFMWRIQSDESAAAGMDGPNYGQAVGWEDGTK